MIHKDSGDTGTGVKIEYIDVSKDLTYNDGQNLAPATATASAGTPANAKKGYVDSTKFVSSSSEWTGGSAGNWIQLSWGAAQTFDKILLYDKASMTDQVLSGTLTFSDGSTVPVGKLQNDGQAGAAITFPAKTVSWVKFTLDSVRGSSAGLGEFQVYNDTNIIPTQSGNLALNKAATYSSDAGSTYNSLKAVDGNISTYWCANNGSFPQWLNVDLGSSQAIGNIKQTFLDTATFYYKIDGSVDGISYTPLVDRTSGGAAGPIIAESVTGTYRHIRLTVTGSSTGNWATSKEFEIYGP